MQALAQFADEVRDVAQERRLQLRQHLDGLEIDVGDLIAACRCLLTLAQGNVLTPKP